MKRKRKLPKYWLGTRVPTSLGYQRASGSNTLVTSTPGESLMPEVNSMKLNYIPNALTTLSLNALYPMLALLNWGVSTAATTAANTALANAGTTLPGVSGVSQVNLTLQNIRNIGQSGSATAMQKGLNAAGKAASIVGTAYGAYNMYNDIANMNSHRSASDMANTLTTYNVTTDQGTLYTQRGGLDTKTEMAYADASKTLKLTNFFLNQLGLGASVGSFWGPIGTGIGAAAGAVVGGLGSLFGFGDTSKETEREAKLLTDVVSMENRLSRSDAYDTDVKNSFYGRTNNTGIVQAANGKLPGYVLGKGVARLSGGEVVQLGGLKAEVPGRKNNKDEYVARKGTLLGEMISDPRSVVWTNKGGISDYIKNGGDESVALEAMKDIQMRYKNGKLPKFNNGGFDEYALMLAPHLAQFGTALHLYNRDKNASTYVPRIEADYSDAIQSAYRMRGDQIYKRPYFNLLNNQTRQALWNARRNPGAGYGGRLMLENSLNRLMLELYGKTALDIDLQNQAQRNKAESALQTLLGHSTDVNNQNMGAWIAMTQLANAAKENAIRLSLYNTTMPLMNGVADYFRRWDTNRAMDQLDKLLALWGSQVDLEWAKYRNALNNGDIAPTKYANKYKLYTPDLLSMATPKMNSTYSQLLPTQLSFTPQKYISGLGMKPWFNGYSIPEFNFSLNRR